MPRTVILASCLTFLAACGSGGGGSQPPPVPADFLAADTRSLTQTVNPSAGAPAAPADAVNPGAATDAGRSQVAREIEEADLYRVAGNLLYLLNAHRGLAIIDLSSYQLLGRLNLQGFPLEMYLRGTRALALVTDLHNGTRLLELSVADSAAPAIARTATMPGGFRTSRVVGDVLYAVTDGSVYSYSLASTPFAPVASLALPDGAQFAHASDAFIFVTSPAIVGGTGSDTRITLVGISDPAGALARRGAIDLAGFVADDQKLSFGGGVLRVVTHDWTNGGLSRLFTINIANPDAPAILATLDLARGEQLFATRFTDHRAYIVTFRRVDPLWIIDLSNPAQPLVAGELVVPGFSTQIVVDGDQLVGLGVDATTSSTIVSLFNVSDPRSPQLLDQEDLGGNGSNALNDRKGFGVFPGLVLVPFWDHLAVLGRTATALALRGSIPLSGGAVRGFPHPAGLVAAGDEEVVIADANTLSVLGQVTVAENVVDVARLADGRLLNLVQTGSKARIGGAELELWAERAYAFGNSVGVLGWDDAGRAAYVIALGGPTPVVSARMDLGWGPIWIGGSGGLGPREIATSGVAVFGPVYAGPQAMLTRSGKLITRGRPAGTPRVFGDGDVFDGLVVIDIPAAALLASVEIRGGVITGFVADHETLAFTFARFAGTDTANRPLIRHQYVRANLDTGQASEPVTVPGYLVAADGANAFTVDEQWDQDWALTTEVVAVSVGSLEAVVLDRLVLPVAAYDLRAAGATLFYTEGNDLAVPVFAQAGAAVPWLPSTRIGTVRLGTRLAEGPAIDGADAFRWLLLPEDGSALVSRDALSVERWDVSGAMATLSWVNEVPGYPLQAHPDPAASGRYLLALGFAGTAELPY